MSDDQIPLFKRFSVPAFCLKPTQFENHAVSIFRGLVFSVPVFFSTLPGLVTGTAKLSFILHLVVGKGCHLAAFLGKRIHAMIAHFPLPRSKFGVHPGRRSSISCIRFALTIRKKAL